jgi:hypothetical protein
MWLSAISAGRENGHDRTPPSGWPRVVRSHWKRFERVAMATVKRGSCDLGNLPVP